MSCKKLLQEMIAVTLIMPFLVNCGTRATITIPEVPAPTPTPVPIAHIRRYSDPYLGFVVEYPLGWEVTDYWELQDPTGQSLRGIEFRSNLYMGGDQAFGRYRVNVAMGEAMGTVTDTVEHRLSPIIPGVRNRIERHCCLTVGGEPSIELTGFPWGRWGSRQIAIVHGERAYWLTFYPYDLQFNTPSDIVAREALRPFCVVSRLFRSPYLLHPRSRQFLPRPCVPHREP